MDLGGLVWWFVAGRLFCGVTGCVFALRALRKLRDERVIREAIGRNGMESFTLRVIIFLVSVIAISLGLTALNAAFVLPVVGDGPVVPRRVWGAGILFVWSALCWGVALLLMLLMPILKRMARERDAERAT